MAVSERQGPNRAATLNDVAQTGMSRIDRWLVSEVYYPEETSTGHYMTLIAEGLARRTRVGVICARPNYSRRGAPVPARETRRGVEIFRCWGSTFDKNRLPLRLINMITLGTVMFFSVLRRIRRHDRVLVGTNPPVLPFLVAIACRLRGARCVLKVEDVYPDNMIVAGLISRGGWIARGLNGLNRRLYLGMETILVLGRDMARCVREKAGPAVPPVVRIPNWADLDTISRLPRAQNTLLAELKLGEKFVVGYAGNIGPLQNIGFLFNCMEALRSEPRIHFLVIGSGKMAGWLGRAVQEAGLANVTLLGPKPREEQTVFLGACDLGIVSLSAGMAGLGVPSRVYNLMAAGRPVIASVDTDSEIVALVAEEQIGWVVPPGDTAAFVGAIRAACSDPAGVALRGERARQAAERTYSPETVIEQYCQILL